MNHASARREAPPREQPQAAQPPAVEEPPPFLGSWRNVYAFVLGELLLLIAGFYALTRWLS